MRAGGLRVVAFHLPLEAPASKRMHRDSRPRQLELGPQQRSQPRHEATPARRASAAARSSLRSVTACRAIAQGGTPEEVKAEYPIGRRLLMALCFWAAAATLPRALIQSQRSATAAHSLHYAPSAYDFRCSCFCCCTADFKTETEKSFQNPDNFDPIEDEYGRPVRRLYSGRIKKRVSKPFHTSLLHRLRMRLACNARCRREQWVAETAERVAAGCAGRAVRQRQQRGQRPRYR